MGRSQALYLPDENQMVAAIMDLNQVTFQTRHTSGNDRATVRTFFETNTLEFVTRITREYF